MLADRRAKIVATIGPSTRSEENLENAIRAGMNVARLNFSHGSHPEHQEVRKSYKPRFPFCKICRVPRSEWESLKKVPLKSKPVMRSPSPPIKSWVGPALSPATSKNCPWPVPRERKFFWMMGFWSYRSPKCRVTKSKPRLFSAES
jgi:hypothetical protein